MTNFKQAADLNREPGLSCWRSIGGVVAGLRLRAEAQREEAARFEEPTFVPVAWAAE